jgi:ABC transporter DrrB family efflux protein
MTAFAMTVSDTLVLARRNLKRIPRQPDLLVAYTIQPVMFVLLFVFVFGGAIQTPGFDYVDFLMPGIIVQSIAFGGFVTALGLSEDVQKGLIDRFRSLPMSRGAVLAGRTLSDVPLNCLSLIVLLTVGFIAGFNFIDASAGEIVLGIVLLLLLGYAFSWIFALVGLFSSSPETANSIGFTLLFPLTFASSVFVPVNSMPDGLRQFAEANPFTTVSDAMRSLWLGTPAHTDVWMSFVWCAVSSPCSRHWPSAGTATSRRASVRAWRRRTTSPKRNGPGSGARPSSRAWPSPWLIPAGPSRRSRNRARR